MWNLWLTLVAACLLVASVSGECQTTKCEEFCLLGYMKDTNGCDICNMCKTNGIIEDDILVDEKTYGALNYRYAPNLERSRQKRAAMRDRTMQWPKVGSVVPVAYTFQRYLPYRVKQAILKGIREYEAKTCIRLVPRTNQRNYIEFSNFGGCNSFIGMTGGAQTVNIAANCIKHGTILHEIMHALGFWHEQSRGDRDDYVTILWHNLIPGTEGNFEKNVRDWNPYGSKYDYNSVMHYGGYYNSKVYGVAPTIVNKFTDVPIKAQREGFTKDDLFQINMKYTCTDYLDKKIPHGQVAVATADTCVDKSDRCWQLANRRNCRENEIVRTTCFKTCTGCTSQLAATPAPIIATQAPIQECIDKNQNCAFWASHRLCVVGSHVQYMHKQCRKSCGICYNTVQTTTTTQPVTTTTKIVTTRPPVSASPQCIDKDKSCKYWASQDLCITGQHVTFMRFQCKKSCNLCHNVVTVKPTTTPAPVTTKPVVITTSAICRDENKECSFWSREGLCNSGNFVTFMQKSCKRSCDLCFQNVRKTVTPVCKDKVTKCPEYQKQGLCTTLVTYMQENCKETCGLCQTTEKDTEKENEAKCGIVSEITQGDDSTTVQSPWIASIRSHDGKHVCGATLISNQHLVTSAQCFGNTHNPNPVLYYGYLGKFYTNDETNNKGQLKVTFADIITFPDFDFTKNFHDIAIIKMSSPVIYSKYIKPACLPKQEIHPNAEGYGTVTGLIKDGEKSGKLQQVKVKTITNLQCKKWIGDVGLSTDVITKDVFCASQLKEQGDICLSKNGDPLTIVQDQSHVLSGIVSFGFKCGWHQRPGGYTKVAEKVEWINRIISS